jgi:hypothetical protein
VGSGKQYRVSFRAGLDEVAPSSVVRNHAQQIVERYDLRAGDALQLAAALEGCADVPRGRKF